MADEPAPRSVDAIDWDDMHGSTMALPTALEALSSQGVLFDALARPESVRVERFPNFYKLVLSEFTNGTSLRLHLFPKPATGSRHSHRWAFASRVLFGNLLHRLFEADVVYETREPGAEPLVMRREETAGSSYVLWPSHVHSIEALGPSLTLVARGPEVRDTRFVDIPGVERGWSRRYVTGNRVVVGDDLERDERDFALGEARRLLSLGPGSSGAS